MQRALLDLGASVNLLPFTEYERLGLGELKPTKMVIQLANRSTRLPRGVVEDVLNRVVNLFIQWTLLCLKWRR